MVKISKEEAMELSKQGVSWHENGICRTYSSNHHYFLSETKRNMALLETIRESKITVRW